MKRLLLLAPLLVGCTNHGGVALPDGFTMPGTADLYTCEITGEHAQSYCDTGEHPQSVSYTHLTLPTKA